MYRVLLLLFIAKTREGTTVVDEACYPLTRFGLLSTRWATYALRQLAPLVDHACSRHSLTPSSVEYKKTASKMKLPTTSLSEINSSSCLSASLLLLLCSSA
ncbi:uncharacterized protein F5147DRAFT_720823 [Suillus discolor]|uniref:Secreted protein n=1 Tax=Suillus discolor TaxID=1912936 RepID=A0A9P7JND6_9AGAM|nr:uncharacterized protein F5147DRAFT_720823 [Suillus discolor]KAG2093515.1 hypothetical protein F5147DRAFT_720823 [Suillus discolor]